MKMIVQRSLTRSRRTLMKLKMRRMMMRRSKMLGMTMLMLRRIGRMIGILRRRRRGKLEPCW